MNTIIANCLIVVINLGIFGLNLKLYTEILKDKSQDRRQGKSKEDHS